MLIRITPDNTISQSSEGTYETVCHPDATLYLAGKCYDMEYRKVSADTFMIHIRQNVESALCNHTGIYSAIYYDKKNHNLSFFTDALGMGKLYYYMDNNVLLLSDHTDEIVREANTIFHIDYSAWAQFLAFSYVLGSQTFFEEIKSCRPGSVFSLPIDSWTLHEIPSNLFTGIAENHIMDFDYAVETTVQHLKSVIHRILQNNEKERIICPLSGGYDSRCIAACLKNLGQEHVETCTSYWDDGNGADEVFAKRIADYLQFPNVQFTPDEEYFEREISTYLHDVNYESSMYVIFWDFLRKLNFSDSILFDGYAGDRLLRIARQASINHINGNDLSPDFLDTFFNQNVNKQLKSCMDKRHYSYLIYLAKQGLDQELKQWDYNLTLYYMFNRNSRNMAYGVWYLNQFVDVFTPFTDYSFIKFALTIPYSIKSNECFYKTVINRLINGLGDLPSTNDTPASIFEKPIILNSDRYKNLLLKELDDYWESIGGIYYTNSLKENMEKLDEKKWRLSRLALPFWVYKKWRKHYSSKLSCPSLETYFKETVKVTDYESISIITSSDTNRPEVINRWLEFIKCETETPSSKNLLNRLSSKHHKTKVLFTMDVEGFNDGPLFSHGIYDFTDAHKAVEQLIFGGKLANGHTVLETLAANQDIPFTFFTEIYTPIITREELYKLLSVCNSSGNIAGLHCHAFGLPQNFLTDRNLAPDDYKSKQGFSKILQYGIDIFKNAGQTSPQIYRSGNFQVYPDHFKSLKENNFKMDSSLYYESVNNHSGLASNLKNECAMIDGIFEIPCTSFYDIATDRASKLDFNLLPFEKKVECIARNIVAGNRTITLLMHSWSFSDYHVLKGQYGKLSKLCHYKVSEQALDELRYLAEFVKMTEKAELITMEKLYTSEKSVLKRNPVDLVDVCGEPVHLPVCKMPPSYGKLRELPREGFIDLKQGQLLSNDMSQTLSLFTAHELDIMLPEKKQPHAGDFTEVTYAIPVKCKKQYIIRLVLDCPYFKEKFQDRNTIQYTVHIDNKEIFSNYITNPARDEYIEYTIKTTSSKIHISIRLDCLKDETPWGWGTCSKVKIKGIHLLAL